MKKRLLSLLVALCMAVTLLPVSALTAWAEESGSTLKPLQIQSGYPVLDDITPTTDSQNHKIYTGDGWNFNASNNTLTLTNGRYDFSGEENALGPLNPNVQLVVESGATLTGGAFKNMPTVKGAGTFKTVTLNGTGSITAVNGLASGDWGNTLYVVKTGNNTITASEPILDINRILLKKVYPDSSNKNTVCINTLSIFGGYLARWIFLCDF